jgi:hypothetical protein
MTCSALRPLALAPSLGSVDPLFKGSSGSVPEWPDSSLASENQAWQGRREHEWHRHSRDRGRRQAPVCSRQRGASPTERTQTTPKVPDAPVSKFTLSLDGGNKGLLQNSANLCSTPQRISVKMVGQNGKTTNENSLLATPCAKEAKKQSKGRKARSADNTRRAGR